MKLDLKIPWRSKDEKTRLAEGAEFYGIRDQWAQHDTGVVPWNNLKALNATIAGVAAPYATASQIKVLQNFYVFDDSSSAFTATIPEDDTQPQSSEGTQFLSQVITPTTTGNKIRVRAVVPFGASATGTVCLALFEPNVIHATNAIAVSFTRITGGVGATLSLQFQYTTASVSALSFRLRIGNSSAGNLYLNSGNASGREYGGASLASMTVEEIV